MALTEEDAAALRAHLEGLQLEKGAAEAANPEYEATLERLRKERSMSTSFDEQGGGSLADRRGTAATTMGPCGHVGGVSAVVWGMDYFIFLGVLYQNSLRNALPTSTLLRTDGLGFS